MHAYRSLFVLAALVVGTFLTHTSAFACAEGEESVCNWVNEDVCNYEWVQTCDNVWTCSDPGDLSTCHYENQCHTDFVNVCRTQTNYKCECVAAPVDPVPGATCVSSQCASCVNYRRWCGSWDTCRSVWNDGKYENCSPN